MRVLLASLFLIGCHRELDVPECAKSEQGCTDAAPDSQIADSQIADSQIADSGVDSVFIDSAIDTADACECAPGTVEPLTGSCPGALEKKTRTCATSCKWGAEICALPKGWTAIADPPVGFPGRYQNSAVWTGGELIVFGGSESETGTPKKDGAIYRPYKNTWEVLPDSPLLTRRMRHASAWTGDAMILYGGFADGVMLADGLIYEPFFKRWEKLPDAPLSGRDAPAAVWVPTVKRFLVWGGRGATTDLADGAEYDPSTWTWTKLPTAPIAGRATHSIHWTGSEVVVFGGQSLSGPLYDGALYNPVTRSWRSLPAISPQLRAPVTGITSTGALVAFGGLDISSEPSAEGAIATLSTSPSWVAIPKPSPAMLSARLSPAVWIHDQDLLVWSGATSSGSALKFEANGATLALATGTWTSISATEAPTGRVFATTVWTGACGLVWSGVGAPGGGVTEVLRDGAIYCP